MLFHVKGASGFHIWWHELYTVSSYYRFWYISHLKRLHAAPMIRKSCAAWFISRLTLLAFRLQHARFVTDIVPAIHKYHGSAQISLFCHQRASIYPRWCVSCSLTSYELCNPAFLSFVSLGSALSKVARALSKLVHKRSSLVFMNILLRFLDVLLCIVWDFDITCHNSLCCFLPPCCQYFWSRETFVGMSRKVII